MSVVVTGGRNRQHKTVKKYQQYCYNQRKDGYINTSLGKFMLASTSWVSEKIQASHFGRLMK